MSGFLEIERLSQGPWQALERGVQRLLLHMGFEDVRLVGGSGDKGADVVANLNGQIWVIQCKHRSGNQKWGVGLLDEISNAITSYGAHVGVLACNSGFQKDLVEMTVKREQELGVRLVLWDFAELVKLFRKLDDYPENRHEPRDYQSTAIESVNNSIMAGKDRALVLMATGLGKTRVAAGVIEDWLNSHGEDSQVLLLAPSLALIPQLDASLWPYLPKSISTHILTGSEKPTYEGGVTIATYQSMANRASDEVGKYGLVIVDEAHHAPADSVTNLLQELNPQFILGLTATPWRGDDQSVEDLFGSTVFEMGIVEGLLKGYLAEVDYDMFMDDVDWGWVQANAGQDISVKELNKHLFVPQRDDAIIARLRASMSEIHNPRTLVFCGSKAHAEQFSNRLKAENVPNYVVHSGLDRFETTRYISEFRNGNVDTLVSVDMLNEGIDVPDVNLVAFLRVTHSRRIFVQQLGRGLRISPGKTKVKVLDFVSDIKRIGAGASINRDAIKFSEDKANTVVVPYDPTQVIKFASQEHEAFVSHYLRDVADLDSDEKRIRLEYPAK